MYAEASREFVYARKEVNDRKREEREPENGYFHLPEHDAFFAIDAATRKNANLLEPNNHIGKERDGKEDEGEGVRGHRAKAWRER
ncbi:hypothetical protein L6452_07030 [Arctium lappa]|uniref:Uncharacterized protein n=1 Tax=Arctium lappa TaxID=4217 RepID=A0ACB9EKQ6_ARCLA|nr:hypothetical protein L6452_07030 [Arctium lappa]